MPLMMNKRRAMALLLAMLLAAALPVQAETVNAAAGGANPYRMVLTAPGGWSNSNTAVVKVSITDRESIGWQKIEYRMNDGSWIDCEDLFKQDKAEITVRENGTFVLRMTDPYGNTFEEHAEIGCIDLSAPTVSASIENQALHITASDDLSGIAGIQVNSMLFTTMANGRLDIDLDANMNRFEKLAVRAFDYAGNFAEPISLDNPCYEPPVDPTPSPAATATAKPTKKPAGATADPAEDATDPTAAPAETAAPVPASPTATPFRGVGSSLIYVSDDPVPTAEPQVIYVTPEPTVEPTVAPTPEPIIKTEYITIGPGMPYQADGNSHTLDVLYSAATNKQFITLQSKAGNTFYLVIDYDKPIDEEAEMYETYFLSLVDERDLLALMSDEEKEEVPTPTPQIVYVTPEPTPVYVTPAPTTAPEPVQEEGRPEQMTAILVLVAILATGGILAFVLLRNKGKGGKTVPDTDFILDDDDDEDETDAADPQA